MKSILPRKAMFCRGLSRGTGEEHVSYGTQVYLEMIKFMRHKTITLALHKLNTALSETGGFLSRYPGLS
jgi:hypothetical protein